MLTFRRVSERKNVVPYLESIVISPIISDPHLTFGHETPVFVRMGRTIVLNCSVVSVIPREEVAWYHNGTIIAQTLRVSNKQICSSNGRKNCSIETSFNFVIEKANFENSGTYRCEADGAKPDEVVVEVIHGT